MASPGHERIQGEASLVRSTEKLSAQERRIAIVKAVRCLFAFKGFQGTTTRELAAAAGVSEALLYKYFPTKESLFEEIKKSILEDPDREQMDRLAVIEPSTSALVLILHSIVSIIASDIARQDDHTAPLRLMIRSLTEDGEFARMMFQSLKKGWIAKVGECLESAIAAEEAVRGPIPIELESWFTFQLTTMVMAHFLPTISVVDTAKPNKDLVRNVVWFALRGLGVKEEAIERYYNPETFSTLKSGFSLPEV